MEYSAQWAIRCQHEAKLWESNLFLTLTYADDRLPWHGSIDVTHMQKFLKRLRKRYDGDIAIPETSGKRPIRYFAAGEYGTKTDRAHWHLLLYNLTLPDYGVGTGIDLQSLHELWPYGHHRVDRFTAGRASYIAGYASKKVYGRIARDRHYAVMREDTGEYFVREPERNLMSKGLGYWYFARHRRDFERGYIEGEGGLKARLPRYYQTKLREDPEYAYDEEDRIQQYLMNQDPAEQTPERLQARSDVHKARITLYRKERE